jgi:hypothetical protein
MKRSSLQSMFRMVATACALIVPTGTTIALAQEAAGPLEQQAVRSSLTPQQLDNLVAPLALYPDPVLSQVLVAATYPLEVVEANQWLQQNRALTGTALMDAARQQNWDPSVQALVAFPDVMARLNQDVRWTTDLGNAFLGQQADVMAAVQRLRARAQANGKLRTTPQEVVTTQVQDGQSVIEIQPADPQIVYVPTYDPTYIWGPPAYGYYPGLFYPTYGFGWGFGIPIGGYYGGWGGWGGWGWGFNWYGRGLYVNGGFFNRYGYRYGGGYRGGYSGYGGYRAGFSGNRAWSHDYSRASRATGSTGYSRSYNTSANSGYRTGAGGQGVRSGANQSFNRGGAANSSVNRGGASQSYNRGGASQSYSRGSSVGQQSARSYSAPAQRSYGGATAGGSAARSYSAPAQGSYGGAAAGGSAARSYSAPAQRSYSAPQARSYSAPTQRSYGGGAAGGSAARSYSAPAQRSYSGGGGGGGARSFGGGGGGGGARSSGGGGGSHGGGRR